MIDVTYSTVLDQPVDIVWSLISDFNNYPVYIDGVTESVIEDGKRGDEVGAVRRFLYRGNWIRQRLGAHSNEQRSLTYVGLEPFAFPGGLVPDTPSPADYEGTMHLRPLIDGDRSVLEWSVSVEAPAVQEELWHSFLSPLIVTWANSLKRTLTRHGRPGAYYSKMFDHPADQVWSAIRQFDEYRWGEGVGKAVIEGGGDPGTPGAIRSFLYYNQRSRQRLVACSNNERSLAWKSVEPFNETLSYYRATLRVTPIVATDGAFVEWSVVFEASMDAVAKWRDHQLAEFGKSLDRLDRLLTHAGGEAPVDYAAQV